MTTQALKPFELGERWHSSEDTELRNLYALGLKDDVISDRMTTNRSASAIQQRRSRLGLVSGGSKRGVGAWTRRENRQIREMFQRGLSDNEMALQLGRTPGAVGKQRSKLKLDRRASGVKVAAKASPSTKAICTITVQGPDNEVRVQTTKATARAVLELLVGV